MFFLFNFWYLAYFFLIVTGYSPDLHKKINPKNQHVEIPVNWSWKSSLWS